MIQTPLKPQSINQPALPPCVKRQCQLQHNPVQQQPVRYCNRGTASDNFADIQSVSANPSTKHDPLPKPLLHPSNCNKQHVVNSSPEAPFPAADPMGFCLGQSCCWDKKGGLAIRSLGSMRSHKPRYHSTANNAAQQTTTNQRSRRVQLPCCCIQQQQHPT